MAMATHKKWAREAEKRGLPIFRSSVEAIVELTNPDNVKMLASLGVLSEEEAEARQMIYLERYSKQIKIEAAMMIDLVRGSIIPAASDAASHYSTLSSTLLTSVPAVVQEGLAKRLAQLISKSADMLEKLEKP